MDEIDFKACDGKLKDVTDGKKKILTNIKQHVEINSEIESKG